jgi:DNA-binding beta-propeller fold protein YncE
LYDLPFPYKTFPALGTQPLDLLQQRMCPIEQMLRSGLLKNCSFCLPTSSFGRLTISPDGKQLYAIVYNGDGVGVQPGGVLVWDIDTSKDKEPSIPGSQPDFSTFLKVQTILDPQKDERWGHRVDAPHGIAVSPDNQRVYLVHGGINRFAVANPNTNDFDALIQDVMISRGFDRSITPFALRVIDPATYDQIVAETASALDLSLALVYASDVTSIFDVSSQEPQGSFVCDVSSQEPQVSSQKPSRSFLSSDRIAKNQRVGINAFEPVFAKRPFDMAVHPRGRQALVPFFQTGNFGVLDLDAQKALERPDDFFQGYVGVTPTKLDRTSWPIDPLDVALLFPRQIQYAQNGRFAVAVHAGSSGHQVCQSDSFNSACAQNGAVSIINAEAITRDINVYDANSNLYKTVDSHGHITNKPDDFGYYSVHPIDPKAVTHLFGYSITLGTNQRFISPRGVAIPPILSFLTPRAGDIVRATDPIHAEWRISGNVVYRIEFRLEQLGNAGGATFPSVNFLSNPLEGESLNRNEAKIEFHRLLGNSVPINGTRLRIYVKAFDGIGNVIVETSAIVTFQQVGG